MQVMLSAWLKLVAPVRRATIVFGAALEPMLISAMMIVIEREKRMLLMDGSPDYGDLVQRQ